MGVDRHVGAHRAGGRDQDRHFHLRVRRGQQGQQRQRNQRDQDQPNRGHAVEHFLFEHGRRTGLSQIDADGKHGDRRVTSCQKVDALQQDMRHGDAAEVEKQADQDCDHKGGGNDFFEGKFSPPAGQKIHPVGPLQQVQEGDEGRHVEGGSVADACGNQRNAEKPRVGEGAGEICHGVLLEKDPGDPHGRPKGNRGGNSADQKADGGLGGLLHQKTLDDDAGQTEVDQDIGQAAGTFQGNLLSLEHQITGRHQQYHDDQLLEQDDCD